MPRPCRECKHYGPNRGEFSFEVNPCEEGRSVRAAEASCPDFSRWERDVEEKDPNGIAQHAAGAKLDAGKTRVGLMFKSFPRALQAVAEVTTYGANKYTPMGWVEVENGQERYDDAKGRHLLKGYIEPVDNESDLDHAAHEAWNALAVLELKLRKAAGVLALVLAMSTPAMANCSFGIECQTSGSQYLLETTDQNRERHSAYRYHKHQEYMRNDGYAGAPLGGYREPLGDSAPTGTHNHGYVHDKNMYGSSIYD